MAAAWSAASVSSPSVASRTKWADPRGAGGATAVAEGGTLASSSCVGVSSAPGRRARAPRARHASASSVAPRSSARRSAASSYKPCRARVRARSARAMLSDSCKTARRSVGDVSTRPRTVRASASTVASAFRRRRAPARADATSLSAASESPARSRSTRSASARLVSGACASSATDRKMARDRSDLPRWEAHASSACPRSSAAWAPRVEAQVAAKGRNPARASSGTLRVARPPAARRTLARAIQAQM